MPPRSKIGKLPESVRRWLDTALAKNNFGGMEIVAEELKSRGFDISKSAVGRYSQNLERKLSAIKASTQAAAAIAAAAPDDADLRSAAVISLVQTEVFDLLVRIQEADDETDSGERLKLLSRAAKSIAELSRASVNQKKWQTEVSTKAAVAADAVEAIAKKGGLSKEALDTIRRDILGIAA